MRVVGARMSSTVGTTWAVRFRASGLFAFVLFGAIWAMTASSYLSPPGAVLIRVLGLGISGLLAAMAVASVVRSKRLAGTDGPIEEARERRFFVNTAVEVVVLLVSYTALRAAGQPVMIAPVSELIVGLHFLRLAGLLGVDSYRATGSALCVTVAMGTIAVIAVPSLTAPIPMVAVMSLAAAWILWISGLVGVWQVYRATAGARAMGVVDLLPGHTGYRV